MDHLSIGTRVRINHYGNENEGDTYDGLEGTVTQLLPKLGYVRVTLDEDPHDFFYEPPLCLPEELELI